VRSDAKAQAVDRQVGWEVRPQLFEEGMGLGGELLRPDRLADGDRQGLALVADRAGAIGDRGSEGVAPAGGDRVELLLFGRSKARAQAIDDCGEGVELHVNYCP